MTDPHPPRRATRELLAWLGLAAGVAATVAIFAPGYMSQDSVSQLHQGRSFNFTDWHPPLMSALWGTLDKLLAGPLPMLILQVGCFWLGLQLLFRVSGASALAATLCAALVVLYPPHLSNLVVIWKDIGMGVALTLGGALLFRAARSGSAFDGVGALLFLGYAAAVRHNALPALVPLAAVGAKGMIDQWLPAAPGQRRRRAIALPLATVAVLVAIIVPGKLTTSTLPVVRTSPLQQILLHDVLAVSIARGQAQLPPYLAQPQRSLDELRRLYTVNEIVPMFCCDNAPFRLRLTEKPDELAQLNATWAQAVRTAPSAYLSHRLAVFESLFGIGRPEVCLPYWVGIVDNPLGLKHEGNRVQRSFTELFEALRSSFLYRGWFILLMLGVLFPLSIVRFGLWHPSTVLAASGLCYELPYLLVATTCDFRMHWWGSVAMVCAFVAHLLGAVRRPATA